MKRKLLFKTMDNFNQTKVKNHLNKRYSTAFEWLASFYNDF